MKHISRNYRLALVLATVACGYRAAAEDGATEITAGAPVLAPDPTTPVAETTDKPAELTAEQKAEVESARLKRLEEIKSKFNNLVDIKETNFHFRKVKNEVKDPDTGKVTGTIETKRPTVALPIPVPSLEGIIDILGAGEGKGVDLLLEAVAAVILEQAREYVNEHEDVNEANFPYEKMSWDNIANLPKAERRGGGISKEVWEDFGKDYVEVMPSVTGKKKESVELAAKVFVSKFAGNTTNKPVLRLLRDQLALYTNNTTQGEQFAPCIEFLSDKLEKLINTDETNLLNAL